MAANSPSVESVKDLSFQPMIPSGHDLHDEGSVDPVYHAKAEGPRAQSSSTRDWDGQVPGTRLCLPSILLSLTVTTQWRLFVVAGFGWFS